jgi:hypothetical protein
MAPGASAVSRSTTSPVAPGKAPNAYDAALVTLELAEIHAALGHTAEVKALARESAPVFQAQGVHREAQQALDLLRHAAEEGRITAELVHGVVTYLYRSPLPLAP